MKTFTQQEVATMLAATGLDPADWDRDGLAEMMETQWAQVESVRAQLAKTDEPALRFDPRWQ